MLIGNDYVDFLENKDKIQSWNMFCNTLNSTKEFVITKRKSKTLNATY